jgi:hypothetical protein
MHYSASKEQNVTVLYFMLGWDRYGLNKKRIGSRYAELVFLHPVGPASEVVRSGASGARIVDALIFMLVWARCNFHKKHHGTRYAELVFLHPVGSAGHVMHLVCPGRETSSHYFSCSGGTGTPNFYFYI